MGQGVEKERDLEQMCKDHCELQTKNASGFVFCFFFLITKQNWSPRHPLFQISSLS